MTIVRVAWLAGVLLFAAPLAHVLWRLRRVRRDDVPWPERRAQTQSAAWARGIRRPVDVLRHEHLPGPITFGMLRPVIVLPADAAAWSAADLRRAIVHELEHIRRYDWLVRLAARAICEGYGFHPLAWVAWRRISLEAERACDVRSWSTMTGRNMPISWSRWHSGSRSHRR